MRPTLPSGCVDTWLLHAIKTQPASLYSLLSIEAWGLSAGRFNKRLVLSLAATQACLFLFIGHHEALGLADLVDSVGALLTPRIRSCMQAAAANVLH